MSLELARTIAAFGGLGLGILNLFILLHKEYLRKAKLKACIKSADIRAVESDLFDIQIDLDIAVRGGDVYVKEIYFENKTPVFNPVHDKCSRKVYNAINYPGFCTLRTKCSEYEGAYKELFKDSFTIANTKIEDKEHRVITIADRIQTERHMDGPWEWPKKDWKLVIVSSAETVTVPFDFVVHESSQINYFCY